MHIPQSMLQGAICPITAGLSIFGIGAAGYATILDTKKTRASSFGAVTALIFVLQMLNFPIQGGTSGHLLGGVLASALLGTPLGVLALTLVVTIQALIFSDGGLTVLGANILNMAIIGAGLGGRIYEFGCKRVATPLARLACLGIAAWCSVVLAALSVSIQLAVDGQIAYATVVPAMVGMHAIIGIGETIITLFCFHFVHASIRGSAAQPGRAAPVFAASVIALLLAPFASVSPDGLEWVAEKYQFLHQGAPAFVGVMPDYVCPWIAHTPTSTWMAGAAGMVLCFSAAWLVFRALDLLLKRAPVRV